MARRGKKKANKQSALAQSQPKKNGDVVVLSDDDDRFSSDKFASMSSAHWFDNTGEVITISDDDEEDYQRMADKFAADQSSSSTDDNDNPSASFPCVPFPVNASKQGIPVSRMNKTGHQQDTTNEKFTVFSTFHAILPELPLNCDRPQGADCRNSFPFKPQKRRGVSTFMKIRNGMNAKRGAYHQNRNGFSRNAAVHGSYADYGIRRNTNHRRGINVANRPTLHSGRGRGRGRGHVRSHMGQRSIAGMASPQQIFFN